jgi:hypothetical protein
LWILGGRTKSDFEHAKRNSCTFEHYLNLRLAEGRQKGQKVKQLARALRIPKIGKWSILGIATAISGKRQEMDSAIACPTPERLGSNNSIYAL